MHNKRVLLMIALICSFFGLQAQILPEGARVDSTLINPDAKRDSAFYPKKDSVVNVRSARSTEEKPAVVKDSARLALERHSRIATRRSMIIPGWGQITNRRWWKVPLIYGGFVGFGLMIDFNHRNYKDLLKELRYNYEKRDLDIPPEEKWINPQFARYDYNRVIDAKDFYRRNRDLAFLLTGAFYAINVIDAYVDATFFRFDVSQNLSLKVSPSYQPSYASALSGSPLLKLSLSFNPPKNRAPHFN